MKPHEFIEADKRRWCIGCNLFQQLRGQTWRPIAIEICSRSTAYAKQVDLICDAIKPTIIVAE